MTPSLPSPSPGIDGPVLVVGDGRMGRALVAAFEAAAVPVVGPARRGETGSTAGTVLLAVPDAAIAAAAHALAPGRLVGHLSGALDLSPLRPHEAFSIHPLMTVTGAGASFAGVTAALAGTTPRAHATAAALAAVLGMTGISVRDEDRAAYHAAASFAANFLVTVEAVAEQLAATAGLDREALVPLVRAAVDNWAERGAAAALTGPVSRGDTATTARQRRAVAERLPDRVALFDALVDATQDLAATPRRHHGGHVNPPIVRTVAELRALLAPQRGAGVGFVPTMGALHEGHLSLLRAARDENGAVVLSIFVNPTQFGEAADLAAYPRTEDADVALAAEAGVDVVFAPSVEEMYPAGFATTVSVGGAITETLEGALRGRSHFDGVATVVAKLLLAVQPDRAYFGAKDAQQVVVVRRMVADLGIPVEIVARPTSRDADGLARSSRNTRLSAAERELAAAIPRSLRAAQDAFASGIRDPRRLAGAVRDELAAARLDPEYVEIVDADDLEPIAEITRPALLALAVRVGAARLIDNVVLVPGVDDRVPLTPAERSHR